MADTTRDILVQCTPRAIESGMLRDNNQDGMMRLFQQVFKKNDAVLEWLRDNDPFGSKVLYEIFDDAIKLNQTAESNGKRSDQTPIPTKRVNPNLMAEDTNSEKFAQVLKSLVKDATISGMAFRVYVNLLLYAGTKGICWPSQELLATEAGVSVRQLREYLKELEDAGWITIQRQRNKPSIYRLNHIVKR
jgi:hypothetical protein